MSDNDSKRQQFINDLRAYADFLVAHPNVPIPTYGIQMTSYTYDDGETIKRAALAVGGWNKHYTDTNLTMTRRIGTHVTIELTATRAAVCTKRVVGVETVEVKDYDNTPTKMVEREIVEWDCHPLLAPTQEA